MGALRRRPAPLHRAPLRRGTGEGDHASDVAPLPVERSGRLSDAGAAGTDLEAARWPADPAPSAVDVTSSEGAAGAALQNCACTRSRGTDTGPRSRLWAGCVKDS